jgi:hypothetical protein
VGAIELLLPVGAGGVLRFLERHGDRAGFTFVAQIAEDSYVVVGPGGWSSARTQLRNVFRLTPRSSAVCAIVAPGRDGYNATASALNSAG